jgi:hypothetical protein
MYTYTTEQMKQLLPIYVYVITETSNKYTMRIVSFIEWLEKEDQTKLLKTKQTHESSNTIR